MNDISKHSWAVNDTGPSEHCLYYRSKIDQALADGNYVIIGDLIKGYASTMRPNIGQHPTQTDLLFADVVETLTAYEELLRLKHKGKALRANRTRNSLERNGITATIEYIVSNNDVSEGFMRLVGAGLGKMTFEYRVIEHPLMFKPFTSVRAIQRLQPLGVI